MLFQRIFKSFLKKVTDAVPKFISTNETGAVMCCYSAKDRY